MPQCLTTCFFNPLGYYWKETSHTKTKNHGSEKVGAGRQRAKGRPKILLYRTKNKNPSLNRLNFLITVPTSTAKHQIAIRNTHGPWLRTVGSFVGLLLSGGRGHLRQRPSFSLCGLKPFVRVRVCVCVFFDMNPQRNG